MKETRSLCIRVGFACLGLVAIMSGGTLEIRHHLLLGALAFVLGIALLVVVAGSYEGTPGK
ncbi:MAG: hypothetical protein M1516_02165 [Firmicutes bacterium]|nr:hypothetical protein [Bacillota bacterium]